MVWRNGTVRTGNGYGRLSSPRRSSVSEGSASCETLADRYQLAANRLLVSPADWRSRGYT